MKKKAFLPACGLLAALLLVPADLLAAARIVMMPISQSAKRDNRGPSSTSAAGRYVLCLEGDWCRVSAGDNGKTKVEVSTSGTAWTDITGDLRDPNSGAQLDWSQVTIYGGGYDAPVTRAGLTRIEMTGGTLRAIMAGGYSQGADSDCLFTSGGVEITVSGGTLDFLSCTGNRQTDVVAGDVTFNLSGFTYGGSMAPVFEDSGTTSATGGPAAHTVTVNGAPALYAFEWVDPDYDPSAATCDHELEIVAIHPDDTYPDAGLVDLHCTRCGRAYPGLTFNRYSSTGYVTGSASLMDVLQPATCQRGRGRYRLVLNCGRSHMEEYYESFILPSEGDHAWQPDGTCPHHPGVEAQAYLSYPEILTDAENPNITYVENHVEAFTSATEAWNMLGNVACMDEMTDRTMTVGLFRDVASCNAYLYAGDHRYFQFLLHGHTFGQSQSAYSNALSIGSNHLTVKDGTMYTDVYSSYSGTDPGLDLDNVEWHTSGSRFEGSTNNIHLRNGSRMYVEYGGQYMSEIVSNGATIYADETSAVYATSLEATSKIGSVEGGVSGLLLQDGEEFSHMGVEYDMDIVYKRTFTAQNVGKWNALYIPFDLTVTAELLQHFDFGDIYSITPIYDTNGDGYVNSKDDTYLMITLLAEGETVNHNTPYLIRPKQAGTFDLVQQGGTLWASFGESISCSNTYTQYTMTGTYYPMNSLKSRGLLFLGNNGTFSQAANDEVTLKPYRWYLEMQSRRGGNVGTGGSVKLLTIGEDATGIDLPVLSDAEADAPMYNLSGQRVSRPTQHGIYIQNGRKVLR